MCVCHAAVTQISVVERGVVGAGSSGRRGGSASEQVEIERGSRSGPPRAAPDGLWFCRTVNKNRVDGGENGKTCPPWRAGRRIESPSKTRFKGWSLSCFPKSRSSLRGAPAARKSSWGRRAVLEGNLELQKPLAAQGLWLSGSGGIA